MNEVKLKDVANIISGPFGSQLHKKDYVSVGTPIVTVEHMVGTSFSTQNLPFVSDKDKIRLKRYILKEGDIVFSRVGSVDRNLYVSKNEDGWLFSGRCLRIRVNQELVNPKFLSFYFRLDNYKKLMVQKSVGATMASLNNKIMEELPLIIPALPIQKAIAHILSMLDDKIEINNAINTELEKIIKMVYDYTFLQHKNEEWEKVKLSILGELKNGVNYEKDSTRGEKTKIINIRNVSACSTYINTSDLDEIHLPRKEIEKCSMTNDDILIARSGIPSAVRMVDTKNESIVYCGFTIRLILKEKQLRNYLFFTLNRNYEYYKNKTGGSIMPNISQDTLKDLDIILPSSEIINQFNNQVEPLLSKISNNEKGNVELTTLRDFLLPMLMNGQVTVGGTTPTESKIISFPVVDGYEQFKQQIAGVAARDSSGVEFDEKTLQGMYKSHCEKVAAHDKQRKKSRN